MFAYLSEHILSLTVRTAGPVLVSDGLGQVIGVVAPRNLPTATVKTRTMLESNRTTELPPHAVLNQGHTPLPTAMKVGLSPWMHIQDLRLGLPDLETAAPAPPPPGRMDVVVTALMTRWMMDPSRGVGVASGMASGSRPRWVTDR